MFGNHIIQQGDDFMSWYRGRLVGKRDLAYYMNESKKDYHFRVRNKDKADNTVVKFVFSPTVDKDRRCYCPCKIAYKRYEEYCKQQELEPLSSRQFKKNMELLGFVYQKHHRFYAGYHSNKVTTAYKNIAFKRE